MLLNKRFTIGEMAKMHNIAESTLRYYDEKGIFHPSIVDPQTNYRYYTIDQFSLLDTIKFLRQLNIPLKEIKKYIDERNPAYALNLLEKQQEMMLKKQRDIEYALAKMEHRIHLIKKATKAETDRIVIKKIPKRKITAIAVAPNTTDDMFDYYIHSLQKNMKQMDDSLFSGDIGVTISKKAFMQNEFQAYSSVFILLDYMPYEVHTSDEIKESLFACSYHHGPYEETDATYRELLSYIDKEGYEVNGDSIEIGLIDWSVTENPEEQVTEIQIPIMKKQSNKM